MLFRSGSAHLMECRRSTSRDLSTIERQKITEQQQEEEGEGIPAAAAAAVQVSAAAAATVTAATACAIAKPHHRPQCLRYSTMQVGTRSTTQSYQPPTAATQLSDISGSDLPPATALGLDISSKKTPSRSVHRPNIDKPLD